MNNQYTTIKEIVAGSGAAITFLVLELKIPIMPWWLSFGLALCSYFGIRLIYPPEYRKILAELPDTVSPAEFTRYLSRCRQVLALLRKDAEAISKRSFQQTVLRLCELGDELVLNFEKDPEDVRVAQALPDRLQRLHEVLTGYLDLAGQKNQSPQTLRAVEDTEKAVTKAVAKFEQLHHRLLENDAIDLSTNAKTLDNLLDFD